jgi:endo-1,4-beta-xylanase
MAMPSPERVPEQKAPTPPMTRALWTKLSFAISLLAACGTGSVDMGALDKSGSDASSSGGQGGSSSAASASGSSSGSGGADAALQADAGGGGGDSGPGTNPIPMGDASTLRAGASSLGRLVGVAFNTTRASESGYATIAATEFDFVTPENEMKWNSTEATQGQFTFSAGDAVVTFATAHDMMVKGHNLVWYNELPAWVSNLTSASAVQSAMTYHISNVAGHYKGQVVAWDVVNEAVADDGSGLRSDVFSQYLGSTYIDIAFQTARAADPKALLLYNDFGIEGNLPKSDAAYALVQSMVARGIPIDGVGFEFHTKAPDAHPPKAAFIANMQRYAALGLKVFVSEFDVELCTGTLTDQETRFHDIVQACFGEPACVAVTVWGVTDMYSWLNGMNCANPMPLLFDDSYNKKPAYTGFLNALNGM